MCSLPADGATPGPATLVSPKDGNALMVPIGSQLKNLTIRGFVLRPPDRDPDQPGFRIDSAGDGLVILGRVDGLTIEDVDSRFFQQNIALDGDHSNVVLRRFKVAYGWAMPTAQNQFPFKGQGVYLNVPARAGGDVGRGPRPQRLARQAPADRAERLPAQPVRAEGIVRRPRSRIARSSTAATSAHSSAPAGRCAVASSATTRTTSAASGR